MEQKIEDWEKYINLSHALHVAMKDQGGVWRNYTEETKKNYTEVIYEILSKRKEEVKTIVNELCPEGTLLHKAASFSGKKVIEKLIELGASRHEKRCINILPWQIAEYFNREPEIVTYLKRDTNNK